MSADRLWRRYFAALHRAAWGRNRNARKRAFHWAGMYATALWRMGEIT